MPTKNHQINVHGIDEEHTLLIASSHGEGESKRIIAKFNLVRQLMKFDVEDKYSDKGKLCDTIEEAIEVYNEI